MLQAKARERERHGAVAGSERFKGELGSEELHSCKPVFRFVDFSNLVRLTHNKDGVRLGLRLAVIRGQFVTLHLEHEAFVICAFSLPAVENVEHTIPHCLVDPLS